MLIWVYLACWVLESDSRTESFLLIAGTIVMDVGTERSLIIESLRQNFDFDQVHPAT